MYKKKIRETSMFELRRNIVEESSKLTILV